MTYNIKYNNPYIYLILKSYTHWLWIIFYSYSLYGYSKLFPKYEVISEVLILPAMFIILLAILSRLHSFYIQRKNVPKELMILIADNLKEEEIVEYAYNANDSTSSTSI